MLGIEPPGPSPESVRCRNDRRGLLQGSAQPDPIDFPNLITSLSASHQREKWHPLYPKGVLLPCRGTQSSVTTGSTCGS